MTFDVARRLHALFLPASRSCGHNRWCPAVDVYRTPSGWLVKVELAGVRPEEVSVTVVGRRLTVRGSRRDWSLAEGHSHHVLEIAYSEFERSLELPGDLGRAVVTTAYQHGMLLISIRNEEVEP
jgi:HSP20 family protein